MKFTCFVDINTPIDFAVNLFDDPANLSEWQDGFVSYEHRSGTPGTPGAKTNFVYLMGKKEMDLLETIVKKDLPDEFTAKYEHKHMVNTMTSSFTKIDALTTRYEATIEYLEFRGFIVKVMAFLAPKMFKKQTQKWFDQFKAFAERTYNESK